MWRTSTPTGVTEEAVTERIWLELVRQHVGSLRYGVVQVTVHDARVTQIEKTERVRLETSRPDNP